MTGLQLTFNLKKHIWSCPSEYKDLSQYDEIKDLSRYGNKDTSKPIYASSPDHWHNNIIKCMSAIK